MGTLADAIMYRRQASNTTSWPAFCSCCKKEEMYVTYNLDGTSECEKCWIKRNTNKQFVTEEKIEQLQKDLEQIAKLMVNVSGYLTELKYDLKKKQQSLLYTLNPLGVPCLQSISPSGFFMQIES